MKLNTTTTPFVRKILISALRKEGFLLRSKNVIDYHFFNKEKDQVAIVQLSTNNGCVRLCLAYGKENLIANEIANCFEGCFEISPMNFDGRPFFICAIVDESDEYAFRHELQNDYMNGLWTPSIPSSKYSFREMFMPINPELAATKVLRAVSFADKVFKQIFPTLDELLPSKIPARFLANQTRIGDAIAMLTRAIELGIGSKQLILFRAFMTDTYETLSFHRKVKDPSWRKALPALELLINKHQVESQIKAVL
jgi:hypothetical protein